MSWFPWCGDGREGFGQWRDRCVKWLRVELRRHGAALQAVAIANTGTAYVKVTTRRGVKCCIRLADHRPGITAVDRSRLLSVRLVAAMRLRQVGSWLAQVDRESTPHRGREGGSGERPCVPLSPVG